MQNKSAHHTSVIAGLEPQQRFASTSERPRGNGFGNGPDRGVRSFGGGGGGYAVRKPSGGFGGGSGGGSGGGFGNNRNDRGGSFQGQPTPQGNGFGDRNFADRAPRPASRVPRRQDDRGFGNTNSFALREDRNFSARNEGFAPRPDFANRKPGFAKQAGKVFVPRDAAKKAGKFSKPVRD